MVASLLLAIGGEIDGVPVLKKMGEVVELVVEVSETLSLTKNGL